MWSGEKIVLVEGEGGGLAVDDDGVGTLFEVGNFKGDDLFEVVDGLGADGVVGLAGSDGNEKSIVLASLLDLVDLGAGVGEVAAGDDVYLDGK